MLNGTSSKRAQEHSTTAKPPLRIRPRSDGLMTCLPLGLQSRSTLVVEELLKPITHETTIPRNRAPTRSTLIRPSRESFFPEQRFGSQWSKSLTRTNSSRANACCKTTNPHRHRNLNFHIVVFISCVSGSAFNRSRWLPDTYLRNRRCCLRPDPDRPPRSLASLPFPLDQHNHDLQMIFHVHVLYAL